MPEEKNKKLNIRQPWLIYGIVGILLIVCIGVIALFKERVTTLEERIDQLKASVAPKEIIPQEVDEVKEVEEESIPPTLGTILELEDTGSKGTDSFSVGGGKYYGVFLITLSDFPPTDKIPFWKISLYKVGEENPRVVHEGESSLEMLKNVEWEPADKIAGGIDGIIFEGPGEFYFKIEVRNVDRWILKVTAGSRG